MKKTLTTDELRQIVDSHEKGYGMSVPINYGYLAARELLANREAQPVAFTSPAQLLKYPNEQKETYGQYSEKFCVPLFTAPPAPATAQPVFFIEIEGDDWINAGRIEGNTRPDLGLLPDGINYLYAASPAAVVNPEFTGAPAVPECFINAVAALESLYRNGQKQNWNERYTTDMAYASGVLNACRAAMLAQPVSQGYKLPPHVFRELVNSLRDTAVKFQGTQQLREQLSRTLKEAGLLAAAPEGGNDPVTRR